MCGDGGGYWEREAGGRGGRGPAEKGREALSPHRSMFRERFPE